MCSKKAEDPTPQEVYQSQVVEATYDGLERDKGSITGNLYCILPDNQMCTVDIDSSVVMNKEIYEKYIRSHLKEGQKLYLVKSVSKEYSNRHLIRIVWLKKPIVNQNKDGSIVVTADNQNKDNSENTLDEMLLKNGIVEIDMHAGKDFQRLRQEAYENKRGIFQNIRN